MKPGKKILCVMMAVFSSAFLTGCLFIQGPRGDWQQKDSTPPEPMKVSSRVIAAGGGSFAILEDGSLLVWGASSFDNTGDNEWLKPTKKMEDVTAAVMDNFGRHAIKNDGTLWTCGTGSDKVMDNVISLSAYDGTFAAITSDGCLWMWGRNNYNKISGSAEEKYSSPYMVMENIADVSVNYRCTLAVDSANTLWAWGLIDEITGKDTREAVPERVKIADDVVSVSGLMAIKSDGSLWNFRKSPEKIMDDVVSISSAKNSYIASSSLTGHYLAITSDGALWSWGDNLGGQVGDGTFDNKRQEPVKIMESVVYAFAGGGHSIAVTSSGDLWAWGENAAGQLGMGNTFGVYERGGWHGEYWAIWPEPVKVIEYEEPAVSA